MDMLFIALTFIFFLASWGLVELVAHLQKEI